MYKKVDTSLNFLDREKEVLDFWRENDVYKKSERKNVGGQPFCFYDGPPRQTASRTSATCLPAR